MGSEIQPAVLGVGVGAMLTAMLFFMTQTGANYSRIWFGFSVIGSLVLVTSMSLLVKRLIKVGANSVRFIVVGTDPVAQRIHEKLTDPNGMLICVGHIDKSFNNNEDVTADLYDICNHIEEERLKGTAIDQVWITHDIFTSLDSIEIEKVFATTAAQPVYIPQLPGVPGLVQPEISFISGFPTIGAGLEDHKRLDNLAKWIQDKVLGLIAIIALLPLFALIAVLIKLDSPGPILFRQRRYGQSGKEFEIYKFRTMTHTASEEEFKQATKNDARITKIGAFLRRTSLDELPQLFNVLQGTMSLVGPRPHPVALNEEYRDIIGGYMSRHRVKPGLTGLAQINGFRGETAEEGAMQGRIALDLEYIKSWTTLKDLQIMLQTIARIFRDPNAY